MKLGCFIQRELSSLNGKKHMFQAPKIEVSCPMIQFNTWEISCRETLRCQSGIDLGILVDLTNKCRERKKQQPLVQVSCGHTLATNLRAQWWAADVTLVWHLRAGWIQMISAWFQLSKKKGNGELPPSSSRHAASKMSAYFHGSNHLGKMDILVMDATHSIHSTLDAEPAPPHLLGWQAAVMLPAGVWAGALTFMFTGRLAWWHRRDVLDPESHSNETQKSFKCRLYQCCRHDGVHIYTLYPLVSKRGNGKFEKCCWNRNFASMDRPFSSHFILWRHQPLPLKSSILSLT